MIYDITQEEFSWLVVQQGFTVKEIQEFYGGISRSQVYHYKRKWGLTGLNSSLVFTEESSINTKKCSNCDKTKPLEDFYSNGYQPNGKKKYKSKCKKCYETNSYSNHENNILSILEELGKEYKCERCGYNKNSAAITFHHIDPAEKEFGIAEVSKTSSRAKLLNEIKKCIVLCHNCHMEEHYPHLTRNSR